MQVTAIAGAALVTALLAQMLRKEKPEIASAMTIGAGALLAGFVLTAMVPVLLEMEQLLTGSGADQAVISVLVKCLGVCLVVQFASDCCKDAGEAALAGRVEFAGKAAVITLSLPLFKKILALSLELIG